MIDLDDKIIVIIAVTLLGALSMFFLEGAEQIVSNIVSGLFGIAVGRGLK